MESPAGTIPESIRNQIVVNLALTPQQPLSATFGSGGFELLKRHYGNLRRPDVKPQREGKIMCVPHVWHNATYNGSIHMGCRVEAIEAEPRSSGQVAEV
jgi:hypothetical protein